MNIEQLRKDMEAGTQGDWFEGWGDGLTGPSMARALDATDSGMHPIGTSEGGCVGAVSTETPIVDARRIARVPQLERIALAAEAMAKTLQTIANDPENIEPWFLARQALAAYREATK